MFETPTLHLDLSEDSGPLGVGLFRGRKLGIVVKIGPKDSNLSNKDEMFPLDCCESFPRGSI